MKAMTSGLTSNLSAGSLYAPLLAKERARTSGEWEGTKRSDREMRARSFPFCNGVRRPKRQARSAAQATR